MENKNKLSVVGAIIAAGILIAGAIIYTNNPAADKQSAGLAEQKKETSQPTDKNPSPENVQPTNNEHMLGNPDAPVTLILYSDIECPYCRQFHKTMHQLIDEYGKNGELKWIYRHFPLEMLHPTAKIEAEATECAAELGGNEKFWQYLDDLSTNLIPKENIENELTKVAEKIGLDEVKFKECLTSGKYKQKIESSMQNAANDGARGTPYGIIINTSGEKTTVPGALPYEQMKQMIDQLLKN